MSDQLEMQALLRIAGDITTRIRDVYAVHGVGQAVESQVLIMLRSALDCLERARVLAGGDDHNVESITSGIAFLTAQIEEHKAERDAWAVAYAMIEAAKATKH